MPRDVDAELLLQCMRDNPTSYSVEPVGLITETHRFRCQYHMRIFNCSLANAIRPSRLSICCIDGPFDGEHAPVYLSI